jgi:hypothetical protein
MSRPPAPSPIRAETTGIYPAPAGWGSANVFAPALRTVIGPSRAKKLTPPVPAFRTDKLSLNRLDNASLDSEGLCIDDRIRDLLMGGPDNIAEGLPGNIHLFGCVLLV